MGIISALILSLDGRHLSHQRAHLFLETYNEIFLLDVLVDIWNPGTKEAEVSLIQDQTGL